LSLVFIQKLRVISKKEYTGFSCLLKLDPATVVWQYPAFRWGSQDYYYIALELFGSIHPHQAIAVTRRRMASFWALCCECALNRI